MLFRSDGARYLDLALGDTAAMAGHSPEPVVRAVAEQLARGTTTMLPSEAAIGAAEELARRFGLPLFVARTIRTEGAHFRIEARELEVPKTGDAQADTVEATRRIHAVFEEWIAEHPEQWMWAHRKWL